MLKHQAREGCQEMTYNTSLSTLLTELTAMIASLLCDSDLKIQLALHAFN